MQRAQNRYQEAADFRVEDREQHRHRYYNRMGIYHKLVTEGAQMSGNSSVLVLDPKFRADLQMLYSVKLEP